MASYLATPIGFVSSSENTDSDLTAMCNGIRIHIAISAENLKPSPSVRGRYLHFLQAIEPDEEDFDEENLDEDALTINDLFDWLLDGCAPEFRRLLPPPNYPPTPTLEDYIHAKTLHYTLYATEDDKFALVERTNGIRQRRSLGVSVSEELCSSLPSFDPSQVQICAESPEEALSREPQKVQTDDGQTHFFKPYYFSDGNLARGELQKYEQIRRARVGDLRICQLFGLVRDRSGKVLGLLLSYIDSELVTLACAVEPETAMSLRQRWAEQVTQTLTSLHAAGITWGDAKPENVLVDLEDNAWIVDFGGLYTEGWVDEDIAGTVQGDLQGLSKIVEYINATYTGTATINPLFMPLS